MLLLMRRSLNITMEAFCKTIFNGSSGLLLFDARALFEADHAKDLSLMDRKRVHIYISQ